MAEPIRNNEYILAHQEEFRAAKERAREYFMKFDGVKGVGIGTKYRKGSFQNDICIVIFVKEKKAKDLVSPEQLIPEFFEGYPTDVFKVHSGSTLACSGGDATYEHMMGGIQLALARYTTTTDPNDLNRTITTIESSLGTMACIVKKRGDTSRDNVYLLSNRHVLYSYAGAGDYVYHPYPARVQDKDSTTLGPVQAGPFFQNEAFPPGSSMQYFLDCAIARIDIDCFCLGTRCTKDTIKHKPGKIVYKDDSNVVHEIDITGIRDSITDLHILHTKVYKYVSVTKKTEGFIRHIDSHVDELRENGNVIATDLKNLVSIEFDAASTSNHLNCNGRPTFAEHGDSGSLIIDGDGKAIALLFSGPPLTVPNPIPSEFYFCHASPIIPVLDKLNICLPVIGSATTHGTCAATDGSGQAPAPSTASGGGALRIENTGALGNGNAGSSKEPAFLQPEPITEEQQEHLTSLLNAFRRTEQGRELHDAFAHVRREIGYLVRNCRPVTVVWHRNKGPGFFALLLNHLRGDRENFPHEIGDAKLSVLLDKMEVELSRNGSNPLRETLQRYGDSLRAMLFSGNNVNDFIDHLEKTEQS